MRIFIGASEVANFVTSYQLGFKAVGCDTYTIISRRNPFLMTAKYDVVLSEISNLKNKHSRIIANVFGSIRARYSAVRVFLRALFLCDIFIYNTGGSLLPGFLDYFLIKLLGKKLVVVFLGSEIRHWYAYQEEMIRLGKHGKVSPFIEAIREQRFGFYDDKLRRIRKAERYADLILSQPGFAQLQKRNYMRVTAGLNLEMFSFNVPENSIPIVLHAPTNRDIKGTKIIIKAVEQLRIEGLKFEFQLIEKMPHSEIIQILSKADILVDEIYSDTIGVLSTEAMATGTVVLTNYFPDYAKVPGDCPVVQVDKDNILECLRRVILDRDLRRRLAHEGRAYVEKNHDIVKICRQILNWLKPEGIREYDFAPTFYKTFSIPPEILRRERIYSRREKASCFSRLLSR